MCGKILTTLPLTISFSLHLRGILEYSTAQKRTNFVQGYKEILSAIVNVLKE